MIIISPCLGVVAERRGGGRSAGRRRTCITTLCQGSGCGGGGGETRPWIEGERVYPRVVTAAAQHDAPLDAREERDEVVFATGRHVLGVGRPGEAEQAAKVALHRAHGLHVQCRGVARRPIAEREDAHVAVLASGGHVLTAGREGELVDAVESTSTATATATAAHTPTSSEAATNTARAAVAATAVVVVVVVVVDGS